LNAAAGCQLAIGAGTICWLTGTASGAIKPMKGIIDCGNSCGSAGQVLLSTGANALCWGAIPAATPTTTGIVLGCTNATNAALGCNALRSNTTGSGNVAIGLNAGCSLTTQVNNVFVGNGAGLASVASGNVGIGTSALQASTTAGRNTAVGEQASQANVISEYNAAFGWSALQNATGGCNTAVGGVAGQAITSGTYNVAIGANVQVPFGNQSCQLAIGWEGNRWLTGNSTKAIQPGAGIIDCASSCGTAGQVLTSTGSNALQWANAATNWTAAGTIQVVGLSATTTGPSIGTAGFNQVYYRSAGAKMWQVSLVLEKVVGGVDGSGDYLFTLPNGLQFDTTLQTQRLWTGNVGSSNNDLILLGLQGSTGAMNQSPSLSTILQPVIWSATQYRLITNLSGQYRAWSSGLFNMNSAKYATTQFQFQST
jgi:hypothetical protein